MASWMVEASKPEKQGEKRKSQRLQQLARRIIPTSMQTDVATEEQAEQVKISMPHICCATLLFDSST
jgi:hypothetical protein